jgi:uncharacterized protein YciI
VIAGAASFAGVPSWNTRLRFWNLETRTYNLSVHYLLFYEAGADYAERRKPFRDAHLAHARAAVTRDGLVLGGAFANPVDGAVLLFRGGSPAAAEQFAKSDPYVVNGVVKRWYVREWTTVVGEGAETRI